MIFRPSLRAAFLAAVALGVAACSGEPVPPPPPGMEEREGAIAPLLAEADRAMANGRLTLAGRLLDKARSLDSESPDLWTAIARLRLRGGEHLTAIEAVDQALAYGPNHAPALLLRAVMVRDVHGAAGSLLWFEAARKADPDHADVLAEYAATLGDSGDAGAMLAAVRALAEVAPDDPRVPWLQAVLAARGGQFAIARSLLTRSGMVTRGLPAALLLDAVISLDEGNADSAAATLETLAGRQPANTRSRELLAHALLAGGREEELVRRFGDDALLPEASPYLSMLVARAHERLGNRRAAAPLLARAYRPPGQTPVQLVERNGLPEPTARIRRTLLAEDRMGARNLAESLRARFPASADVAVLTGDALIGGSDPERALSSYARASEARRPWPFTRKAVWALTRHGDASAAKLLLSRHVAGAPQNASAVIELARRQAVLGDWQQASLLLDHALRLDAGHDPVLLELRVRAARGLGDSAETERFAELLAEVRPRNLTAP